MELKIKNGTRPDIDLCRSCRNVTLVEGPAAMQQIKKCSVLDQVLTFPVVSCTDYDDKNSTDLWDMKQIAWVVDVKGTRRVGFLSPADRLKNGGPDID